MPDFEVKITTAAELSGAQASLAALQDQIEATKTLGKNVDELAEKETRLRQAIVQAQLNDITGKGGEAARQMEATGEAAKKGAQGIGEFVGGHKGIHAIGHALNNAIPGMQQFTRFLSSTFTAAIGVALLGYEYLNAKIEEYSKLADDLAGSDNAAGGWAKKLAQNLRDSHVAADVLATDIQRILNAQERVAQTTDTLIARQKQQQEAANNVADAQKELEEARLELAEKLGDVTPEQAIKIKLEIDEEDFRRKQEAKIAGIQAELQARQKEQSTLGGRGGALDQDEQVVDRARAAVDTAKNAKDRNDTLLENARENLKAAEDDEKKADEWLQSHPHHWGDRADTQMREKVVEPALESAENKIVQYRQEIGQYEKKETGLNEAAENAKNDLEEATSQWKDDAKAAHELNKTIDNLTASLAGAQAESAALISLHNQAAEVRARAQNAPNEKAARDVQLHRAMEPDQGAGEVQAEQSQFNDLSRRAAGAMSQSDQAAKMGGYGAPNVRDLVTLVQQLTQFLQEHPALQPQAHDDMQQEIDDLKQSISRLTVRTNTNQWSP